MRATTPHVASGKSGEAENLSSCTVQYEQELNLWMIDLFGLRATLTTSAHVCSCSVSEMKTTEQKVQVTSGQATETHYTNIQLDNGIRLMAKGW